MSQKDTTPADASLRFTGTKCLVSANAVEGKSTSTAFADLTAFTWSLRLRIDRIGGENYVLELGAGPAQGDQTALGFNVNPSGGAYIIKVFARVNNGSSTQQVPVQLLNVAQPSGGAPLIVGLCVKGWKVGGRWEYQGYTDGVQNWGEPIHGPTGFDRFGKLSTPYRLMVGESFYGSDLSFADCLFWANRVLSESEIRDAHNGKIAVRSLYPADQAIALDAAGVNHGQHTLAAYFSTAGGTTIGTGTMESAGPLAPMPVVEVEGHVMQSGKTLLFLPRNPDGSIGSFAATIPELTGHPVIKVNGGSPIALSRPYYLTYGPFVAYPVVGPMGFRTAPLLPEDQVTFAIPTAWLICGGGLTKPYVDEAMVNRVGQPGTLAGPIPAAKDRTLGGGINAFFEQPFADYTIVGSPGWQGVSASTVDVKGNLTKLEDTEVTYPLTLKLFSARVNFAWWWSHGPGVPFGLNTVKAGRCAVTWTGQPPAEGSTGDQLREAGVASSGGPDANKQVSWIDLTNGVSTPATTPGGRHVFAFDLAYLPGTTGRAVPTSQAGDTFVRKSRAICCNLEWRAKKAAGTGARADMRFHPPGVDPANPGHFNPALLSALAELRPHAIRWIFDLEPSWHTWRDLSHLRRTDDPTRRLFTYPEFRSEFRITQIRDYAEGGPNNAYLPAAHGGGLLRITTAEPHGFGILPEAFRIHGSGRHELVLGDAREQWEGRYLIGRRLSDTELLINIGINSGYGVRKWLGDALTQDLGSVGLPYIPNRLTPTEWIELSNHAKGAPWINVSVGTRPEAIQALADQVARGLDPGIGSYWEWGNEIWNSVFQSWMAAYSAAHSMPGSGATFACTVAGGSIAGATVGTPGSDYYFGGDGWYPLTVSGGGGSGAVLRAHFVKGKADRVKVVAGGTGYTAPPTLALPEANNLLVFGYASPVIPLVCSRMMWLRGLVRNAYSVAGRDPNEARVVLAGQGEFGGYMANLVEYSAIAGFPIDTLSPATYDQFTGGWNDAIGWRSLDTGQQFDMLDACVSCAPMADNIVAMRMKLDAHGYTETRIDAYEGGMESCLPGDNHAHGATPEASIADLGRAGVASMTLAYMPRMREIWQTRYHQYQQAGLDSEQQFYWGDDGGGYGGMNPPTNWHVAIGPAMQLGRGDGSDGRYDNRLDPLGHDKTVSVIYGAMADWNVASVAPTEPKAEVRLEGRLSLTSGMTLSVTTPTPVPNPGATLALAGRLTFQGNAAVTATAPTTPITPPNVPLRPCPYCGAVDIVLVASVIGRRGHYRCFPCGSRGPEVRAHRGEDLAAEAAEAWNSRVLAESKA